MALDPVSLGRRPNGLASRHPQPARFPLRPTLRAAPHIGSENVTLHTINLNIIQANWKRAQRHARAMQTLITASILLRVVAAILPGTAAAVLLTLNSLPGALGLLAAALARTLAAAAARQGQDIGQLDLPRAAAEDIAPAVERAGVQTLIFGHSHIPDRARFPTARTSPPAQFAGGTKGVEYTTSTLARGSTSSPPTPPSKRPPAPTPTWTTTARLVCFSGPIGGLSSLSSLENSQRGSVDPILIWRHYCSL